MERRRGLMWPFINASSSRNIPVVMGIMASAALSRTTNEIATSANRDQMGEQLLGRRCLDTCSPERPFGSLAARRTCANG